MPTNDIYILEVHGLCNGVFSRTTFHFQLRLPTASAAAFVQYAKEQILPDMLPRMGFTWQPVKLYSSCISQPLLDEYAMIINDEVGEHAAFCIDPRVTGYIRLTGKNSQSENYNGGIFWPGIPVDWAQEAPKLHPAGILSLQQWCDLMRSRYGDGGNNPFYRWGVFSRKMFRDHPNDLNMYWREVADAAVRPYLAHLRTRRPRGPF